MMRNKENKLIRKNYIKEIEIQVAAAVVGLGVKHRRKIRKGRLNNRKRRRRRRRKMWNRRSKGWLIYQKKNCH